MFRKAVIILSSFFFISLSGWASGVGRPTSMTTTKSTGSSKSSPPKTADGLVESSQQTITPTVTEENLTGNAVEMAAREAELTLRHELQNNVNAGAPLPGDPRLAAVYPKSSAPDFRDSFPSTAKKGPEIRQDYIRGHRGYLDREARSNSEFINSLSGSSSLPPPEASR